MISRKLHPQTIIAGYRKAVDRARQALSDAAKDNGNDKDKFAEVGVARDWWVWPAFWLLCKYVLDGMALLEEDLAMLFGRTSIVLDPLGDYFYLDTGRLLLFRHCYCS